MGASNTNGSHTHTHSRAEEHGVLDSWKASGIVETIDVQLSADHSVEDECDDAADGGPYEIDDLDLPELPIHPGGCQCSYRINSIAEAA